MSPAVAEVLRPQDAAGVAETLRELGGSGRTAVIRGATTKAAWGGSLSTVDVALETTGLVGVVGHEPGDRVVTVRSGTPLRSLQATLALAGQRLAVESGFVDATVGGVLATGEAGPLRLRHGAARDVLIGVEFVRADGVVAHSGGRVVKNVAGYDLGRLLCGSYGTVGVITQATFRLHPLPAAWAWVVAPLLTVADIVPLVAAAESPSVVPAAIELDWARGAGTIAVLVEGSRAGVVARAESLRSALASQADVTGTVVVDAPPPWWGAYPFGPGDVGLRVSVPVSAQPRAIGVLLEHLGDAVTVRGSAGTGVLHAGLPATVAVASLQAALRGVRALLPRTGGSCVVVTAPAQTRAAVDMWGPVPGLQLMRRLKAQFDPAGRFASGRFVGGL